MLEIEKEIYIFKTKEIWFSDYPFDVTGYDTVTFRACKNKVDIKGFTREEFTTLVIDLTQDLDMIWKNMERGSCRKRIKRAEREGVKIKLNQNYEEFYEINRSFRKNKGLNKGLPAGSEKIDIIKKYATLVVAELDGDILCGRLYLEDENNIRSWISASKRFEVDKEKSALIGCANRLIHWQAIQYAKEKGIKEFDMGGYYDREAKDEQKEGINVFKKSFGGELTAHYIYQKDYSKLYKLAKMIYQLKQGGIK